MNAKKKTNIEQVTHSQTTTPKRPSVISDFVLGSFDEDFEVVDWHANPPPSLPMPADATKQNEEIKQSLSASGSSVPSFTLYLEDEDRRFGCKADHIVSDFADEQLALSTGREMAWKMCEDWIDQLRLQDVCKIIATTGLRGFPCICVKGLKGCDEGHSILYYVEYSLLTDEPRQYIP